MGRDTRNALLVMFALMILGAAPLWQWPKTAIVDDYGVVRGGTTALNVGSTPITYTGNGTATVGISSGVLVTAGAFAHVLTVQTLPNSTCNTWLQPSGGIASIDAGALVQSGGGAYTFGTIASPMPTTNITAVTDCASPQTVMLVGG